MASSSTSPMSATLTTNVEFNSATTQSLHRSPTPVSKTDSALTTTTTTITPPKTAKPSTPLKPATLNDYRGKSVISASPPPPVETMAARLNRRLSLHERSPPNNPKSPQSLPLRSQIYRPPQIMAALPPCPTRRPGGSRPSPFHDWGHGCQRMPSCGENDPDFFLVGKLLSARPPNPNSLKGFFHSRWKLQGSLNILEKPEGRFVFVFGIKADRRRILKSGPWKFDNALMVFVEYDGVTSIKDVALDKLGFWVDVVSVAPGFHKKGNLKLIGNAIGEYVDYDWKQFQDGFVRIRVAVNLHFPVLLHGPVTMEDGTSQHLEFWYENMLGRCIKCGMLTHFGLPCNGAELPEFQPPPEVPEAVNSTKTEPPPLLRALLQQIAPTGNMVKQIVCADTSAREVKKEEDSVESRPTKRNLDVEFDMDVTGVPQIMKPIKKDQEVTERVRRKFRGKSVQKVPEARDKRERDDPMDIDQAASLKKYKHSLAIVEAKVIDESAPSAATKVSNSISVMAAKVVAKKKKGRPLGSKNKAKKERLAPSKEIRKNRLMSHSPSVSPSGKNSSGVSFPVITYPDSAGSPKKSGGAASA